MLDGAARVGPLMKAAAAEGMPAIAMTDHGNMFGAYDFWKQATANGVKPIIGTEATSLRVRRAATAPACAGADSTRTRTTSAAPAPTRT